MILDWRTSNRDPRAEGGHRKHVRILDADGIDVGPVFWCDTETGEIGFYARNESGAYRVSPDRTSLVKVFETRPAPLTVILWHEVADVPIVVEVYGD